jgi:CheY-like chemotaxis protein
VVSVPGHGTEFTLCFPVGEAVPAAAPPVPLGPMPTLRVLVVDDEEPVLSVLTDLLRSMGQAVRCELGGAAGLAALAEQKFDAVFSDLGMPEVNGWDLALAVKSRHPGTAVVLVSGWGFQLDGGAAHAHGVDLVMPKPFSISEVERVLRQLGEARGRNRAAA